MKRLAAIDIGTNSMRLMLCEIEGNSIKRKDKELIVTRIGKDVSRTGVIMEKSITKNIEALKYFKNKADRYGAEEVYAIATSAVRDASNREAFIAAAAAQAGVKIRVISGEEEAELGITGVMSEIENPEDSALIIDIGGGSTELVLGNRDRIDYIASIPAGTVRMTEQYITCNPITYEDMSNLRDRLDELFKKPLEFLAGKRIDRVFAIGGTATTIAAMFHGLSIYDPGIVHNTVISIGFISEIFERLRNMSIKERYSVRGLQKERADVIPAGVYILKHLLEGLKRDNLIISENDNLEGVVIKCMMEAANNNRRV